MYYRMGKTETILTEGHHYYVEDGVEHITFYENDYGRKLKGMWEELQRPPKEKKGKWRLFGTR